MKDSKVQALIHLFSQSNSGMSEKQYKAKDKLSNFVQQSWDLFDNKDEYKGDVIKGIPSDFIQELFETIDPEVDGLEEVFEVFDI